MLVLVPLVLGIYQVGFVLHVRNTMTSAASEGARQAAAVDGTPQAGEQRTAALIADSVGSEYADDVDAVPTTVDGYPGVEVRVRASVPALGILGPRIDLTVEGHAVAELPP